MKALIYHNVVVLVDFRMNMLLKWFSGFGWDCFNGDLRILFSICGNLNDCVGPYFVHLFEKGMLYLKLQVHCENENSLEKWIGKRTCTIDFWLVLFNLCFMIVVSNSPNSETIQ